MQCYRQTPMCENLRVTCERDNPNLVWWRGSSDTAVEDQDYGLASTSAEARERVT